MCIIKTAGVNKHTSLDIVRVGTLPPTLWVEEWVNRVISTLILLLLNLPVLPNGVLDGIQYAIRQFE